MKATGLAVRFAGWGVGKPPDKMNATSLCVNDRLVWPRWCNGEFVPATLEDFPEGGVFQLAIPSGVLVGTIHSVRLGCSDYDLAEIPRICMEGATWAGKANGLAGGLSGAGEFQYRANSRTVVETSDWDSPVPFFVYDLVRALAGEITYARGRSSEGKREVMRRLFEVCLDELDKEVQDGKVPARA